MSLDNHKITTYEDSVASLPDYPSDAGITAKELKAIFDGRSDKEIKSKHNSLIDELNERFEGVDTDVSAKILEHQMSENAHAELFGEIRELISASVSDKVTEEELENIISGIEAVLLGKADKNELDAKVDKVTGKGLSTNDFTDENVMAIDNAFSEALYAQAELERHMNDKSNPHKVTAEQVGATTESDVREIAYNTFVTSADYQILYGDVQVLKESKADKSELEDYVKRDAYDTDIAYYDEQIFNNVDNIAANTERVTALEENLGDIDTALDAILAIQESYINGENL